MLSAGCIIVGEDNHVRPTEGIGVRARPFTGTTGIGGGGHSKLSEPVSVFFSFDNKHSTSGSHGRQHLWKAIEHALDTLEIPSPAARSFGPRLTLSKVFGIQSDHLIKQSAIG